jgi:hypothetical protein
MLRRQFKPERFFGRCGDLRMTAALTIAPHVLRAFTAEPVLFSRLLNAYMQAHAHVIATYVTATLAIATARV